MRRFDEGDRVRVDIPDETDSDYDSWYRFEGMVVSVREDDAGIERLRLDSDNAQLNQLPNAGCAEDILPD